MRSTRLAEYTLEDPVGNRTGLTGVLFAGKPHVARAESRG